jgi:solute:Na+ symporter, SSS family
MGAILVVFSAATGLGLHILPGTSNEEHAGAVATLIARLGETAPWFVGILAVCALAAVQGFAALYVSTTATMLVRDVYRRYFDPQLDIPSQRRGAQIAAGLLVLAALLIATFAPAAQSQLGALALGFGFQLLPVLAGLCWLPWITREAATLGLAAGLIAVVFTETLGISLSGFFGLHLPWGRWPWTIHSAGWGMACNLAVCVVLSLISQRRAETARRKAYHDFMRTHDTRKPVRHFLRPLAWAATLIWLFFAIGPGALYGNQAFGDPNGGLATWALGMPPLWVWQIGWWAIGVLLIWFLADGMSFSTRPGRMIEPLPRSQRPASDVAVLENDRLRGWIWAIALAAGFAVLANWIFG